MALGACGAHTGAVENRAAEPAASASAPLVLIERAMVPLARLPGEPLRAIAPAPPRTPEVIATPAPPPRDRAPEIAALRAQIAASRAGAARVELQRRLVDVLTEQADATPDAPAPRDEALALRAAILTAPTFAAMAHADEFLFATGHALMRAGRPADARKVLLQLIKDFPTSARVPDAYLAFGDFYFEQNQLVDAEQFYQQVVKFPGAATAAYARYKLGWVHANLGRFPEALEDFAAVMGAGDLALRRAAGNDLVFAYAQIGRADRALALFTRLDRDRGAELLARLAQQYLDLGRVDDAITAFHEVIAHAPDAARRCAASLGALRASLVIGPRAATLREATAVTHAIAGEPCRAEADGVLAELAWAWHTELPKSEADPREVAQAWALADAVATDARRAIIRRNLAGLRWELARHGDARAWIDAAHAARDVTVVAPADADMAQAMVDALDNAIRVARHRGALDPALRQILRAELDAVPAAARDRAQALRAAL